MLKTVYGEYPGQRGQRRRWKKCWRMPSSGMWCRVDLVWRDVSEEHPRRQHSSYSPLWKHQILQKNVDLFFNIRGIIQFESVPDGPTVNHTFHVEVLKRLIDAVRRMRGELWKDRSQIYHDNMPAHSLLQGFAVFSRKRHRSSTVLSLLGSSWLLAASKTQECAERKAFLGHWGH
jgi:hypothetical protein